MITTDYVREVATILEAACARNLSVEIHCQSSGSLQVARSRLLAVDEAGAYLDSPQNDGRGIRFMEGVEVHVYLTVDDGWRMFRSRVTRSSCKIKLNATKTVLGMAISLPAQMEQTQRREDFRVSVACGEAIAAQLHTASHDDPNCCPLDAKRFGGRLVDLSAGGLALRVDASEHGSFRPGDRYFVSYVLPDGQGEMTCLVEVRHAGPILDGDATRLGVKFLPWNEPETKFNIRRLTRYGTELQRKGVR